MLEDILFRGNSMKSNIVPKNPTRTQLVVYCALFIAISVVLKLIFEIYIPIGGFPSLRINFSALPIMLSGIMLGPIPGFIVGIISDLINYVIKPNGPLFLGFTISSGLVGLIPGFLWFVLKNRKIQWVRWINLTLSLIAIFYLIGSGSLSFEGSQIFFMGEPVSTLFAILIFIIIVLFSAFPFISPYILKKNRAEIDDLLLFIITIEQIINSVLLNTIWLSFLYGQAWRVLLPARIITNVFIIPFYTIVIALILRVLQPDIKVK